MTNHHHLWRKLTACLTASVAGLSMAACGASGEKTDSAKTKTLTGLTATEIAAQMGAGWNLGNSLDAYSGRKGNETAWGNPEITSELLDSVKKAGFDTIRIPVTYMNQIGDAPDYTIDEEWLNRVHEVVDWAIDDGFFVIIDIHHDGNNDWTSGAWINCTETDQEPIRTRFQKTWEQLAEKFAEYDQHLIFESMNEIHDGSYQEPSGEDGQFWYDNINTLNQIFVDTVRSSGGNNADRCLLVPGFNTNIDYTIAGFEAPTDAAEDRLMLSVHYYDPYDFALKETPRIYGWGNDSSNKDSWGNEDYVDAQFDKLKTTYVDAGIPVIIGEYGCVNKGYDNYRRYYNEYIAKAAHDRGIVPVYWDNGWDGDYGFALFNRSTGEVTHQEIIDGIMRGVSGENYEIELPE